MKKRLITIADLKELYDSIIIGKTYDLYDFQCGDFMEPIIHRRTIYGKKKHSDWSYSLSCESMVDGKLVGEYRWIVASGHQGIRHRIVAAVERTI